MAITLIDPVSDIQAAANSFSPNFTTQPVSGDMIIVLVMGKPYNGTVTVEDSAGGGGYTRIGATRFTDGTTAAGVDVGSMFVEAWYRIADGTENTDATVTEGGTAWNIVTAGNLLYRKAADDTWDTPVIVGGGDATAGTGFSVTAGSNPGITVGDFCISFAGFRSDAATPCSSHLTPTATGITFSNTHDPATDFETTTGGDMGTCITRSTISSGTASAAPVLAATLAASHTGSAAFIRLRVIPPTPRDLFWRDKRAIYHILPH